MKILAVPCAFQECWQSCLKHRNLFGQLWHISGNLIVQKSWTNPTDHMFSCYVRIAEILRLTHSTPSILSNLEQGSNWLPVCCPTSLFFVSRWNTELPQLFILSFSSQFWATWIFMLCNVNWNHQEGVVQWSNLFLWHWCQMTPLIQVWLHRSGWCSAYFCTRSVLLGDFNCGALHAW